MEYPLLTQAQLRIYLKALRLKAGYSQQHMGKLLGISQQSYQALERDPGKSSFSRIWQVLQILNAELVLRDKHDGACVTEALPTAQSDAKEPTSTRTAMRKAVHSTIPVQVESAAQSSDTPPSHSVVQIRTATGKKVEW